MRREQMLLHPPIPGAPRRAPFPSFSIVLELEAAFTRPFRQRLDASMEEPAASVEDDRLDLDRFRSVGQHLPHRLRSVQGLRRRQRRSKGLVHRGGCRQRLARRIVNDLSIDVFFASEDAEAWPARDSEYSLSDPSLSACELFNLVLRHHNEPIFRSSLLSYGGLRRRSGCLSACRHLGA